LKVKAPDSQPVTSTQKQIDSFLEKYTPKMEKLARAALAKMRKRLPSGIEFVQHQRA
jgi:hypothetical protein